MYTYPLLAQAFHNKDTLISFTLEDGPCPLTRETFCLTRRPGTPILSYSNIMQGMDINNLFEGDIISIRGKDYQIKYQRGFNAISLHGDVIELSRNKKYKVITHSLLQDKFKQISPTKIKYKYKDFLFSIEDIFGSLDSKTILINNRNYYTVPIIDIQQYAGIKRDSKKIFFGDIIDNQRVVLENGKIINR